MVGGPFEGGEPGDNPEREPESLEELRSGLGRKYPEAELRHVAAHAEIPLERPDAKRWEGGKEFFAQKSHDEKEVVNELEALGQELKGKYPVPENETTIHEAFEAGVKKQENGPSRDDARVDKASVEGRSPASQDAGNRHPEIMHAQNRGTQNEREGQVEGKSDPISPFRKEMQDESVPKKTDRQQGSVDLHAPNELAGVAPELHQKPIGDSRHEPLRTTATENAYDADPQSDNRQTRREAGALDWRHKSRTSPPSGETNEFHDTRVIESTLQGERSGRPTFAIRKSLIEDAVGVKLGNGREYEIRGRISGVGDFRMRHVESGGDRIFLRVPKEAQSSNLKFGENYKLVIESVEERREFHVINTREAGPSVKISRASIETWRLHEGDGAKNERRVVDLRFSNVTRPEQPTKRYFAVYDPRREELNLRIGRAGARPGDVLRLQERREYGIERFLRDFETHKIEALNNVTLRIEQEGLQMKVDERSFLLREPRLDARGLKAILTAKIGRTDAPIRFAFDGEKVTMKLFDDAHVTGLKSEHGLAIRYDQGGGASRTFRLLDAFRRESLDSRIRLVSIPETEQGAFHLKADPWLVAHVRDRLARCNGHVFLRQKGDISEEICRHALSLAPFWNEIADHPRNTSRAEGSRRTGPDSLQRLLSSGELFYFEFKWWSEQQASSEGSARRQARYYLKRFSTYRGEKVAGAFIGFLDWNVKSDKLEFYVERVI